MAQRAHMAEQLTGVVVKSAWMAEQLIGVMA
jgi:hypothetical protein